MDIFKIDLLNAMPSLPMSESLQWLLPVFVMLSLWSLFWKGLALWHSGRRGQQWWFMAILVVNSVGILEIVYIFFVLKLKLHDLFRK